MKEEERPPTARHWPSEFGRLLLLVAAGGWLLHPFATGRLYGAGDALWYSNMLADYVLQLRAGVFPVFVGQTIHAFNGAVYPLRVAPLYQHLAGALDLLTFHQLGIFELQHLVVILCGGAGHFSCYLVLRAIAPEWRWLAALLAILYLSCPGILALAYTQDLYMSWTTVPFLPLAGYGLIRTFRRDDWKAQLWLAVPLAALWWGHSPIAMWMTVAAVFTQAIRLILVWRTTSTRWAAIQRAGFGAAVFILLAQYPFVSVALLKAPGKTSAVAASLPHPETIAANVRAVFPDVLLPLSPGAEELSDLQLGYGLWAVLAFVVAYALRLRSRNIPLALLAFCACGFLGLLTPVPFVNAFIWSHLPRIVQSITLYWPMQRFYPILAALIVCAGQLAVGGRGSSEIVARTRRRTVLLLAAAACAWALWQSTGFVRAAQARTASETASRIALRPENLLLMDHSYGLFPALPATFSHGVMDAEAECRLLSTRTLRPLPPPGSTPIRRPLRGSVDANPGVLRLEPVLHLMPGRRYELSFDFRPHPYQGVLQLAGRTFFREYLLPVSGEARAFGSEPGNSHSLVLWTSDPAGDDVVMRFIPTAAGATPVAYADFGTYTWQEIRESDLPARLQSLLPFRAEIRTDVAAWLETPRMFVPGYRATVDGKPAAVRASPQNQVMVPVSPSSQTVELSYIGPTSLRLSYWVSLLGWGLVAIAAFAGGVRALRFRS